MVIGYWLLALGRQVAKCRNEHRFGWVWAYRSAQHAVRPSLYALRKPFALFAPLFLLLFMACQDERTVEFQRYYSLGKNLYALHCQNCHGSKGEGLGNLYPPLTDTTFLRQNRDSLACWINNGLQKKIIVNGKTFEGKMPADTDTTPIEIAQIITYITNDFGNKQGITDNNILNNQLEKCR